MSAVGWVCAAAHSGAAAARLDFRTAAALKQTLDVLGPKPDGPPPLAAFTSADPDRAADIFFEHGFVSAAATRSRNV